MHIASYVYSYPVHDTARAIKGTAACSLRAANAFLAVISLHAGEILKCRTSISISASIFELPTSAFDCRFGFLTRLAAGG